MCVDPSIRHPSIRHRLIRLSHSCVCVCVCVSVLSSDRNVCSRLLDAAQQILQRAAIWESILHARSLAQRFLQHSSASSVDDKSSAPAGGAGVVPAPILSALQVRTISFAVGASATTAIDPWICCDDCEQAVASILYRVSRSTYVAEAAAGRTGTGGGHAAPPRHSRKALASALAPEWASFTAMGGWGFDAGIGIGSSAAASASTSASVSEVELGSEWRSPNLPIWAARYLHAHRFVHVIVALLNQSPPPPPPSTDAADSKSDSKSAAASDENTARSNARVEVFGAVRPLLLLLASSLNGLAYVSCDATALKALLSSLWGSATAVAGATGSSAAAAAASSNALEVSLVPDGMYQCIKLSAIVGCGLWIVVQQRLTRAVLNMVCSLGADAFVVFSAARIMYGPSAVRHIRSSVASGRFGSLVFSRRSGSV